MTIAPSPADYLRRLPPEALSLAERLALLPDAERTSTLAGLSEEAAASLIHDWAFWARPDQRPPDTPWSIWLFLAGRGAGKSRSGAEWVRQKVARGRQVGNGIFIGATAADTRDLMVEGPSGILSIGHPDDRPDYESSKRLLTWPNGVKAHCRSAEDPNGVRGLNVGWCWADEIVKWRYLQDTWDNLRFAMRVGENPQTVITSTPKPFPLVRELVAGKLPGTVLADRVSTYRNAANLAPAFFDEMTARYEGTRLGRQELWAELLEDVEGALWSHEMIEADRWRGEWAETPEGLFAPALPEMRRIVIGVDPPGSTHTECGIIAVGLGTDNRGYVLADYSLKGSPAEWSKAVVRCAHDNDADRIAGERNYGGDMVKHTIATVPADDVYPAGASFAYKDVNASRGKKVRAEPVVGLYEQHRMVHVGVLAELEDEQCSWVPGEPGPSPNRVDALVWACTELLITHPHRVGRTFGRQIAAARIEI